jgi:hypothetical protein
MMAEQQENSTAYNGVTLAGVAERVVLFFSHGRRGGGQLSAKGKCTGGSGSVSQGAVYRWQCTGGR